MPTGTEYEILKWGLTQGGLVVVLLLGGWVWRRDYIRLLARDDEKLSVLTALVSQSTTASDKNTTATENLRLAVDDLRRSLERKP